MQKMDLENLSDAGLGVPDAWCLDADDKPCSDVFRKHFKLPRSKRKSHNTSKAHNAQELLRTIVAPQARCKLFLKTLIHYRRPGFPIVFAFDSESIGAQLVSPEGFAMALFDPGWHLRNEDELTSFARLDETARQSTQEKLLDLLARHKDVVRAAQAMAGKGKAISQLELEVALKCAIECWLRAREKLSDWTLLDVEQRTRLADVLFSGFVFMGSAALIDVIKEQPELSVHYRSFLHSNHIKPPVTEEADPQVDEEKPACVVTDPCADAVPLQSLPDVHATSQPVSGLDLPFDAEPACSPTPPACPGPESLQQLYELISTISLSGKSQADTGPEQGLLIQSLLAQHLERLTELRERLSQEAISGLIEHYCQAVLLMTDELDFSHSDDHRDLVPVLCSAWKFTVIEALKNGLPEAWFVETLQERRQIPQFVERFNAERAKISEATKAIEAIQAQLAESPYTVKAKLRAGEKRQQSEILDANVEIENIRLEVAHRLVPDGKTLDELMEQASASPHGQAEGAQAVPEQLEPRSVKALQSVVEQLTPSKPAESAQPAPSNPSQHAGAGTAKPQIQQANQAQEPEAAVPALTARPEPEPELNIVPAAQVEAVQEALPEPIESERTAAATAPASVAQPECVAVEDSGNSTATMEPVLPAVCAANDEPMALFDADASCIPDVAEAFGYLPYAESKEAAQQAFALSCEKFSQVPGALIDAIAMHWLDAGHLSVAHQTLKEAEDSLLVVDPVLKALLLRSAFYGMNLWPKDSEALSNIQRDLNLLNPKDLEAQLERKPGGKVVPYLLVCATLQPALFAGGETQAPTLLKMAASHFDGHLKQLIASTAEFTQRGGRVDFETLRNEEAQEAHLAAAKLQDQVNAWLELNSQRATGWHALRVALKICNQKPLLAGAISAIQSGANGDSAAVRSFVSAYSSHAESRRLLEELVTEIRADYSGPIDDIDSHAYTGFCQQIDALVTIAQSWLVEVLPSDVLPKDIQEFLQKFHTQLERSISFLKTQPVHEDVERRAGSQLLLKTLCSLQAQINADTNPKRFDHIDAMFKLPAAVVRLEKRDAGPDEYLQWLTGHLSGANWLEEMLVMAERHNAHWVKLLLLSQLEELGLRPSLSVASVAAEIAKTRAELKEVIDQYRNLSIQALTGELIAESAHLDNMELAKAWLADLLALKPFADLSSMEEDIRKFTSSLEKHLNSSTLALTEELEQGLLDLRTKVDAQAVPQAWEARARGALERRSLTVVRELLNQLQDHIQRNARMSDVSPQENLDLTSFMALEPQLLALLQERQSKREAGDHIIEGQAGGLDYSANKAAFRDVIATLLDLRAKPLKTAKKEKEHYAGVVSVLQFIGFKVPEKFRDATPATVGGCEYRNMAEFRSLKVKVSHPALPKGFPLFERPLSEAAGSDTTVSLNVILLQGTWNLASLTGLKEHGLPDCAVMMVGEPLTCEQRKIFANFCRDQKCAIFLLDPVVLAFLASAPDPQAALGMFLRVTAAWTFYNPYIKGDTRLPAPPEMRFGRESDVASIVEPRGAALVYGGRQLGKTTLLHSAERAFKARDARNYAYCLRMDGQFQHAKEREGMDVKTRVLELMVKKLREDGVLTANNSKGAPEDVLQAEFQRGGSTRVLFCLDEVDSVLNRDARTNFQLVRYLAALVNDSHARFRVVLAGLNNVNRFRTHPNSPLEQLGGSLGVTILDPQDARNLIVQPLSALGYRFEEPELVDRIIAFTNRHPSLLHIFCSELVKQLGSSHKTEYGAHVITQGDVENVENDPDVRKFSGDRFDMTLNLDKRYTVVVYGLLDMYGKSIGTFSVKKALDVARKLVPEEFQQMNETSFGGLIDELVGLGILRKVGQEYAIRNQMILQLIGSPSLISDKLQEAVEDLKNGEEDALTCHPAAANLVPSPLALQDEKLLLTAKAPDGAENYSVSVVMGTPALGLSIQGMKDGFGVINEFLVGSALSRYEARTIPNAQSLDPKRFEEMIAASFTNFAANGPAAVLVSFEEFCSIEKIMMLMSVANEMAVKAKGLKYRLRIVFILGPASVWSWHSHPALTTLPPGLGGIIELNRWTRHACESLLDQQGLVVSSEHAQDLHNASEGWYLPLMKFIEVRKKSKNATSLKDLAKQYTPLVELKAKEFEKFVSQTGMASMSWSMPLAAQLHTYDILSQFSEEDVGSLIEALGADFEAQISPSQAPYVVRWWSALRVIEANTLAASKAADKGGEVTYRFTPALQRAIAEYAALQQSKAVIA